MFTWGHGYGEPFISEESSLTHPAPAVSFSSLGLSSPVLQALERAGYTQPTPIQEKAIPVALTGKDVIGCAATGTGKTAAFVLPIVERLHAKTGTVALVLAPTRELALQIQEHAERFGKPRGLRSTVVIGGVGMGAQIQALRGHPQLVIATPGRLIDHMDEGSVRLDGIELLVLDEADRMLDMGFKPQLTKILARVPKQRQTLLFSATMAGEVADFARQHLKHPERVEVARSGTTAARADQKVYLAGQPEKTALLMALLAQDEDTTLVFTRTKRRADKVTKALRRANHAVACIHADRSQSQRQAALAGFKSGQYRVLVATDIAARGIDVAEIGHVVNYDLPHVPADYVHRVGRTARAAASGRASSFCAPDEVPLLKDIEKFTKKEIARAAVPRDSAVFREEMTRQVDPGRPQPGHGQSGRPPGQQPGRHARSHPKKPQQQGQSQGGGGGHGGGGGGQPQGGYGQPRASAPRTLFRGGPRHH